MSSCPLRFLVSELRVVPRFFVYLLMVVKYFLWRVRNDYHFRDDPPGAISVIECVKARLRDRLFRLRL